MNAVTGMIAPSGLSPTRLIFDQAISKAHRDASAPPSEWPEKHAACYSLTVCIYCIINCQLIYLEKPLRAGPRKGSVPQASWY